MKILQLLFLTFIFSSLLLSQTAQDTSIAKSVRINQLFNEIKSTESQMRSQEWYSEYLAYQQRFAYIRGEIDALATVKDSVLILRKRELK